MRISLCVVSMLGIVLLAGSPLLRAEEEEAGLHPDDASLLTRVAAAMRPGVGVDAFEKALRVGETPGAELESSRDIGFGGALRRYRDAAEDVGVWILALVVEGHLAAVRAGSGDVEEGRPRTQAIALWGEGTEATDDGLVCRRDDVLRVKRLYEAVAGELGVPAASNLSAEDEEAVTLLTDPLADLTFGVACYEDGAPPHGRLAADGLRLGASVAALDQVLRGPNPEGRVYAVEALRLLEREGVELSESVDEAVWCVRELDVAIEACSACLVHTDTAAHLLDATHLVGQVACSVIERLRDGDRWLDVGKVIVYWDGTWVWRRTDVAQIVRSVWLRGRLPEDVHDALFSTLRTGEGMLVHLGTPIYVLHLNDPQAEPPEGIASLHAHLLGVLPRDER